MKVTLFVVTGAPENEEALRIMSELQARDPKIALHIETCGESMREMFEVPFVKDEFASGGYFGLDGLRWYVDQAHPHSGGEIDHQRLIETWAAGDGIFYVHGARTSEQRRAACHVWDDACSHRVCRALREYWQRAPLSGFYDGEDEIAGQLPFLIGEFEKAGWGRGNLLDIQRRRIAALVEALARHGEIAGYVTPEHIAHELKVQAECLCRLAKG